MKKILVAMVLALCVATIAGCSGSSSGTTPKVGSGK